MDYRDFAERVLRVVLEHGDGSLYFGMNGIGRELGLDVGPGWGDREHREVQDAIAHVCQDLKSFGLIAFSDFRGRLTGGA